MENLAKKGEKTEKLSICLQIDYICILYTLKIYMKNTGQIRLTSDIPVAESDTVNTYNGKKEVRVKQNDTEIFYCYHAARFDHNLKKIDEVLTVKKGDIITITVSAWCETVYKQNITLSNINLWANVETPYMYVYLNDGIEIQTN